MDVKCKITCFGVNCALLEVGQKKKVWIKVEDHGRLEHRPNFFTITIILYRLHRASADELTLFVVHDTGVVTFPFIFLASVIPTCPEFQLTRSM